jgi:hypothetical protein
MSEADPEEQHPRSYPADRLFDLLSRDPYKTLGAVWEKSVDRIDSDPSGSITSAKSLLEATCKMVLDRTGTECDLGADLPQLYSAASRALNIAPSQQSDLTYRAIFGSVHTILQSVGELRNKRGDAHGSHRVKYISSISEAELAVNLTGSIVLFLLSTLESFLTLIRRIGSDGRIILKFDKTIVWRLVDHARNSPINLKYYGEETGPAIWLVGDTGIYLMTNGHPRIAIDGLLIEPGKEIEKESLRAHADGCDPAIDELERWWDMHGVVDEGSDFCIPIPVQDFLSILPDAEHGVVIIVGSEDYVVYPDSEFKRVFGENALN